MDRRPVNGSFAVLKTTYANKENHSKLKEQSALLTLLLHH
jgi:hypothetical protein